MCWLCEGGEGCLPGNRGDKYNLSGGGLNVSGMDDYWPEVCPDRALFFFFLRVTLGAHSLVPWRASGIWRAL